MLTDDLEQIVGKLLQEFLAARKEWERARRARAKAWIIFEAVEKLKELEEEGPDSIVLPKNAYVD